MSLKVCAFTGFHSAVVQELTPADCESLNRNWDSCGAPIHSQRLLRQGKDATSELFLQQKAASTNNKQLTRQKLACQLLVVCTCILLLSPKARLSLKPGKAAAFAFFFSGCQLCMVERSLHPSTPAMPTSSRHLSGRFSHLFVAEAKTSKAKTSKAGTCVSKPFCF